MRDVDGLSPEKPYASHVLLAARINNARDQNRRRFLDLRSVNSINRDADQHTHEAAA